MNARLKKLERIAAAQCTEAEPGHDLLHVLRVAENARRIAAAEHADLEVVQSAALLHELFNYPKDHPQSHLSGDICADRAAAVLQAEGYAPEITSAICYCIRYHSFSRGVTPDTLEGKVLQDADRLDAIGAIGIARCFSTGAEMRRPFYNPADPFCQGREPNDKEWTVDHFYRKLLRIPETLHTDTARRLAAERVEFLRLFLAQMASELGESTGAATGPTGAAPAR
ncbi:MAG: HD domain-containing protein [Mycobacterium leprae]